MKTIALGAKVALCGSLSLLSMTCFAAPEDQGMGVYAEIGTTPQSGRSTDSLAVGFVLPFGSRPLFWGGEVSFYGDFFLSAWRAPTPADDSKRTYSQIGAIASTRYRFDEGQSPWFAEAGLGSSVMDPVYHTINGRRFSTAFQFTEFLGVGRSFGARREHELSLRVQHFSNAGIKEPNPGENFMRVRYLYRF